MLEFLLIPGSGKYWTSCWSNECFHYFSFWSYHSFCSLPVLRSHGSECVFPNSIVRLIIRFFGKAVLSLCIAYGLNWLYFDVDNNNLESHAIRRHIFSSMVYGLAHLPFIMVRPQSRCFLTVGDHTCWCCTRVLSYCFRLRRRESGMVNRRLCVPFRRRDQWRSATVLLWWSCNRITMHGLFSPLTLAKFKE